MNTCARVSSKPCRTFITASRDACHHMSSSLHNTTSTCLHTVALSSLWLLSPQDKSSRLVSVTTSRRFHRVPSLPLLHAILRTSYFFGVAHSTYQLALPSTRCVLCSIFRSLTSLSPSSSCSIHGFSLYYNVECKIFSLKCRAYLITPHSLHVVALSFFRGSLSTLGVHFIASRLVLITM
jgi:hypothetical protein